ncbi:MULTISPECIES: NusA-like transcription termination signal-binding factor [Acidiplasma]|jgi:N utilization substance protein A|uniref:Probable transcription termination protein NusA n=2 Tax=Acidiplasma TaxID=507753 RepID=A0A0N8VLK3_9ARCH|nr:MULTISPECIES: NusA-like transcription termination signal-binding factor [Acidiplasma]KJE49435.1 antitermination protein NusA [Acidiplasma sp. MBA-1]KPV47448.1 antitermination protein NusA [Acidiplasma aeolicum]KQB36755.1 antitermination protein NusA [Acidiplasma aeolicum]KQB36764.1 antitermination protein NusA [Acidiplasma cupricumulans]WMT54596.1 MAG: NusA-like transcription termination signal-binding factor [Acidiplasma sp.]
MNEITLDNTTLGYIKLFESYTKTNVYECLENEEMVLFVVGERKLAEIFKKHEKIITDLKDKINKRILMAEYSPDLLTFVHNLFFRYDVKEIDLIWKDNATNVFVSIAPENIGRAIGKESRNVKLMRDAIARYFKIKNVIIKQR